MRPYLVLVLLLPLLTSGCVPRSDFEEEAARAARLQGAVQGLEVEMEQLKASRQQLDLQLGEARQTVLDLQNRNDLLREDLLRARSDLERLERLLESRNEKTGAALGEMRRTIERLEEEKRALALELEKERLARQARLARMRQTYDELVGKLEAEIARGEIVISDLQGQLTVNLVERILFDSGSAELKPQGQEILGRVGETLGEAFDRQIRVEGHTDDVPISPRLHDRFPSNWELSTARATTVVHFLQDRVNIPGKRLAACGFGPYRPVASNATPEGRAQNRRIQIVLAPSSAREIRPEATP